MKKLFAITVIILAGMLAGCGNGGNKTGGQDEKALHAMEQGRIRTLGSRVAVLDSLIQNYNNSVPGNLALEPFVYDSNYLKVFHGEKFNEKFLEIVMAIEAKESEVLTSIRANKIMPHN